MSAWLEASFATLRPRAIAALTRIFRDIDLAEDMFAEACMKALKRWPQDGTPRDPFAWILTVARNAGRDRLRKSARHAALHLLHEPLLEDEVWDVPDPDALRDDVLRLLFICCHPELSRQDQLALALRIVAGLSVDEVARAFLIKPKSMEQRLTRARKTVAAHPVPFETPAPAERGRRLGEVSLMVYLMFNEGWSGSDNDTQIRKALCEEAIRLARLLLGLFPGMSEQSALLSLLLYQYARAGARTDQDGHLVTLEDQDREKWDKAKMAEASSLLQIAERSGHNGPYQIQAAIAAEHTKVKDSKYTNWDHIEALYEALYAAQPTPVIRLNLIATQARTRGADFALESLSSIADDLSSYRWFYTLQAALFAETGKPSQAIAALEVAMELSPTQPEVIAIRREIAKLQEL
ncbi:MAG: sigma-70 family RNA polymerase sigma factor [Paracoccaceae bacterium]